MPITKTICHYGLTITILAVLTAPVATAQSTRPVSGVIAVTTAPVDVAFVNPSGQRIGRQADTGDAIFLNDEITTGSATTMQILLKDQTVFSMGPESVIVFDRFIYDPQEPETASLITTVSKGTFKFISGQISNQNPDAMTIRLPNATAAIRGTSVAGRVNSDGSADLVLLSGAISVVQDATGESVDIIRSGWGVSVASDGTPGTATRLSEDEINALTAEIDFSEVEEETGQSTAGTTGGDEANENQEALDSIVAGEASAATEEEKEALVTKAIQEVETREEAVKVLAFALADDNSNIDATRLGQALLAEERLAVHTNISRDYLQEENNIGVSVESSLLSLVLSGVDVEWTKFIEQPNPHLGNPNPQPDYQGLVSGAYAGSVSYGANGLDLEPADGTGAGQFGYSLTLNYDTLRMTGNYAVSGLSLGGRDYDDLSSAFDTLITDDVPFKQISFTPDGDPDAATDENGNGRLNYGEEMTGILVNAPQSIPTADGGSTHIAQVIVDASFGSITDGSSVVDGNLGMVNVNIKEVQVGGTDAFTGNEVNAQHLSIGDVN